MLTDTFFPFIFVQRNSIVLKIGKSVRLEMLSNLFLLSVWLKSSRDKTTSAILGSLLLFKVGNWRSFYIFREVLRGKAMHFFTVMSSMSPFPKIDALFTVPTQMTRTGCKYQRIENNGIRKPPSVWNRNCRGQHEQVAWSATKKGPFPRRISYIKNFLESPFHYIHFTGLLIGSILL